MTVHEAREETVRGVWSPRFVQALAVYVSSRGPQDYLVYRTLEAADGLVGGQLGCFCIGFRMKQLRGEPATCKHVQRYEEERTT